MLGLSMSLGLGVHPAPSTAIPDDGVLTYSKKLVSPHRELTYAQYFWMGNAVALSGNTLVTGNVGDPYDANWNEAVPLNNWGSAFVYVKQGLNWVLQQKLFAPNHASQGTGLNYGIDVAIDGDTLVICSWASDDIAFHDQNGALFVYTRTAGVWTLQQKISATFPNVPPHFFSMVWGRGTNGKTQLAISGDTIVIGSQNSNNDENGVYVALGSDNMGAIWICTRTAGVWSVLKKCAPVRTGSANYGNGVAIEGTTMVVSQQANPPKIYIYTKSADVWSIQQTITPSTTGTQSINGSVALSGDTLAFDCMNDNLDVNEANSIVAAGSVRIYTRTAGVWTQQQKICPPFRTTNDGFGASLRLQGDVLVVKCLGKDVDENGANTLNNAGIVYVYKRTAGVWTLTNSICQPIRYANTNFGEIAYNNGKLAIGQQNELRDENEANPIGSAPGPGAVYLYE